MDDAALVAKGLMMVFERVAMGLAGVRLRVVRVAQNEEDEKN